MKQFLYLIILVYTGFAFAQPVCSVYKSNGELSKYQACVKAKEAGNYYQFTKEYQEILDEALAIDSTYAYTYQAKGYAYLKSGDFITWIQLMNKAVALEPKMYLGYRGWCRYQFFRDYKGAIADLEQLEAISKGDIGFGQNGDYHLVVAKALCYKGIGDKEEAISVLEKQLQKEDHFVGLYDYLHLGVLYLETLQYDKAISAFKQQDQENTLADNEFYQALAYKGLKDSEKYKSYLSSAWSLYQNRRHMFDPYTHQMDRVFKMDITREMEIAGLSH